VKVVYYYQLLSIDYCYTFVRRLSVVCYICANC